MCDAVCVQGGAIPVGKVGGRWSGKGRTGDGRNRGPECKVGRNLSFGEDLSCAQCKTQFSFDRRAFLRQMQYRNFVQFCATSCSFEQFRAILDVFFVH